MRTCNGLMWTAALAVCLRFPLAAVSQPPAGKEPAAPSLAAILKQRGYAEVAVTFNKSGLMDVEVQVNGRKALLTVDTGAGHTSLDTASARRLGLKTRSTGDTT